MRINNNQLVTAQALNTSFNSPSQQIEMQIGYAVQANVTGAPTGTFKLQASADKAELISPSNYPPTHWSDITGTSIAVTTSGSYFWNVVDPMYTWFRVVYTDTSGGTSTATVTVVVNLKGF